MNIEKDIEILREAASYEGSEMGYEWSRILDMWDDMDHEMFPSLSRELSATISKEASDIETKWAWVEDDSGLVEEFREILKQCELNTREEFDNTNSTSVSLEDRINNIKHFENKLKRLDTSSKYLEYVG